MRYMIVISVIAVFSFFACSDKSDKIEQENEVVLAKVDGEVLAYGDIIYQIPPELRENVSDEDLRDAVETWINTEVLYREAVERGLDKEPDVQALIKWGVKETVAKKLIDSELSASSASPAEIDSVYRTQKDRLIADRDRFRASHILLEDYETAMAVYKRLKNGSEFENLATDYSVDRQSAKAGGDLGYFTADQVEPSFAQTVKKLKIGAFSEPVKTSYGYHIIKLTEKVVSGARLDSLEARSMIENQLLAGKKAAGFQLLIDSLRADSKIELFPLPGPEKRKLQDGK